MMSSDLTTQLSLHFLCLYRASAAGETAGPGENGHQCSGFGHKSGEEQVLSGQP